MNHRGWLRVIFILPIYFILVGLLQYFYTIDFQFPLNLNGFHESSKDLVMMGLTLFVTLLLVYVFTRFIDRQPFQATGLSKCGKAVEAFYSVGLIVFGYLLCYLTLEFNGQIIYQNTHWDGVELLISVGIFFSVALAEELFFRGYILRNLCVSFSWPVALIISAILFSAMHLFNPHLTVLSFCNLFLAGFGLGLAYLIRRSLWLPVTIHFCWNFIQTHVGFAVSGNDAYSLIEIYLPENTILNGGEFGIEGSVLAILFQLIGIAVLWGWYRNNNPKSVATSTD